MSTGARRLTARALSRFAALPQGPLKDSRPSVATLVLLFACKTQSIADTHPVDTVTPFANLPTAPVTPPTVSARRAPALQGCRVLRVNDATIERAPGKRMPLLAGTVVGEPMRIDINSGGEVVLKAQASARELRLVGPGSFRPCLAPDGDTWIMHGSAETLTGGGEAPGASAFLVTPFGIVRPDNSQTLVTVSTRSTTVLVHHGTAYTAPIDVNLRTDAAQESTPFAPSRLDEGKSMHLTRSFVPSSLVTSCEHAAARSAAAEKVILTNGDAVARSMDARTEARVACTWAALALVSTPTDSGDFSRRIAASDTLWRTGVAAP